MNGYKGIDFCSEKLTKDDFIYACKELLNDGGCCAIMPTVITSPMSAYEHVLPLIASVIEDNCEQSGKLLGIHLEGPFISPVPGAIGCHRTECVVPADVEMFKKMVALGKGHVKMITIAAEWPNSVALCKWAVSQNIVVSLGHHVATSSDIHNLAYAGATLLTHLGNGLPNEINRHHNPIWGGLSDYRLSAMLITDG